MKRVMKTQLVDGVEVHRGSGNVFADLGLADAEKLKIKTGLVIEIRKATRSRGLTQQRNKGSVPLFTTEK
jgi:predicted XRE-type DNA-binding protein